MRTFSDIYHTACIHKGGESEVESMLPKAKTSAQLRVMTDDRYLSDMTRRVFRAGLKHEMVDNKWPAFEEVFKRFEPLYCAMLSDDDLDMAMKDRRIIRHFGKIKSVRANGNFFREIAQEHDSFGKFLADWPSDDIVGLWIYLKKHAKQMGGNSGAAFLRMVGKDTFLLTRDVVAVLINEGVIDKEPTSQTALRAVQKAFNEWQQQSGRAMCEISRIVSFTATV